MPGEELDSKFRMEYLPFTGIYSQISDTDGIVVTSGEAITWAIRLAQHFKQRGLDHRDVIGIVARNSTYILSLGVACLLNLTPFHAVNPMFDEGSQRQRVYLLIVVKQLFITQRV